MRRSWFERTPWTVADLDWTGLGHGDQASARVRSFLMYSNCARCRACQGFVRYGKVNSERRACVQESRLRTLRIDDPGRDRACEPSTAGGGVSFKTSSRDGGVSLAPQERLAAMRTAPRLPHEKIRRTPGASRCVLHGARVSPGVDGSKHDLRSTPRFRILELEVGEQPARSAIAICGAEVVARRRPCRWHDYWKGASRSRWRSARLALAFFFPARAAAVGRVTIPLIVRPGEILTVPRSGNCGAAPCADGIRSSGATAFEEQVFREPACRPTQVKTSFPHARRGHMRGLCWREHASRGYRSNRNNPQHFNGVACPPVARPPYSARNSGGSKRQRREAANRVDPSAACPKPTRCCVKPPARRHGRGQRSRGMIRRPRIAATGGPQAMQLVCRRRHRTKLARRFQTPKGIMPPRVSLDHGDMRGMSYGHRTGRSAVPRSPSRTD